MSRTVIHWYRQDLRLPDNAALALAAERGERVVPVYIWDLAGEGDWAPGAAGRWFLHHALDDLGRQIGRRGGRLVIEQGPALEVLRRLAQESGAEAVYWNRRYEPAIRARDEEIKRALVEDGLEARSCNSRLLLEPWEICTQAGDPYKVFTPFSRAARKEGFRAPVEVELEALTFAREGPAGLALEDLGLLPERSWDERFPEYWEPTREGGWKRLEQFLAGPVKAYAKARDIPGEDGTSRLSPFLHWGLLGPREVAAALGPLSEQGEGARTFFNELLWREFAHHVLFHFPHTPEEPLQPHFAAFPWRKAPAQLEAWQNGQTGYPIVDAGMRQLWAVGWMHNRVRMVVASFLVKHLLLPWQAGERWFWETLVDADLANNTLGWQWAGGCGADAAPYFRIFNPVLQGKKFDPEGDYVRT